MSRLFKGKEVVSPDNGIHVDQGWKIPCRIAIDQGFLMEDGKPGWFDLQSEKEPTVRYAISDSRQKRVKRTLALSSHECPS